MTDKSYIGFDIGGTKCAVVLGDADGHILRKEKFATSDPATTIERLFTAAETLIASSPTPVVSVGVSCGGPLDPVRGVILSPPNLPGWDAVPIVDKIRERLGLPAILCNDANACALAEWQFGAGRGTESMVFLTFGTGLGAGIVLNGKIYNGVNGNAGEIGHIRMNRFGPVGYGKAGSLEGFASGGGIASLSKTAATEAIASGKSPLYCQTLAELDTVTAKSVADAAYRGDETARAVYATAGEMLGRGLAILTDILNPDCIVIGSIYVRARDLIEPSLRAVMQAECLPMTYEAVSVVPAALGEAIGDIAALSLAIAADKEGE